jgi:hypothetical protein
LPIKGLTDDIAPRLPSLGKLRKGAEKPERGPGKDLQHFRFDGAKPAITEAFMAAYGAAPGSLTVYLPYPAAEACFDTWQEEWAAGGLVHRCDGQTMTVWREGSGYARGAKPCPYYTGEKQRIKNRQPGCDEVGRLVVILPELIRAGHVGYVTLETHSKHDMLNILGALKAAEEAAGARGLLGIPFTLYRREEEISTPTDDGGRATRKKWLVFIEPQAAWVQVRMQLAHAEALALPAAEVIDGETGEYVERVEAPAPRQIEAPVPTAAAGQLPADVKSIVDKYVPPTEQPPAPPPASQSAPATTGNAPSPAKPGPRMLKTWSELVTEAKAAGVAVPVLTDDVTAAQLSEVGKRLREAITAHKAKPATPPAAPDQPALGQPAPEKTTFTRAELIAYVKQMGEDAKKYGLVGLAWTFNPNWDNDKVVEVGKDLKARIAEHLAKTETAHA